MLKQKFSDKFTNIFSRDKKEKEESKKEQQFFNQSYFQCKLVYSPHRLSLIKVIANIIVGPDAGTPLMVNCKWFIKKNGQYSEIQGVTSSCYQPCIEDVGCSVLVQITPLIEGKTYSGATISKETGPLELGTAIETRFTQIKSKLYYEQECIQFSTRIEAVFGKQCEYSALDYPQDGKLIIRKQQDSNFEIQITTSYFTTFFWITKQFPTLQFIRKSYNSVVVSFTEFQSMRLAFKQGIDRQILALLLRTLTANSTLDWPGNDCEKTCQSSPLNLQHNKDIGISTSQSVQVQQQNSQQESLNNIYIEEPSPIKSQIQVKSFQQLKVQTVPIQQIQNQSNLNTHDQGYDTRHSSSSSPILDLQIKIGELNTQLNKARKDYKQLMKNYNIEKQNKCKFEQQFKKANEKLNDYQGIRKQHSQLSVTNQKLVNDNRFFRNELTLLNKQLKIKETEINRLKALNQDLGGKLKFVESDQQSLNNKATIQGSTQADNCIKINNELSQQNQELKREIQKLENTLATTNKKLQSLMQQKVINTPEKSRIQPLNHQSAGPFAKEVSENHQKIANLEFKISNLQMLLKHRSGEKGNESITLHKIINSLTEDITQKSEQMNQLRNINRQLMDKIKKLSSR